MGLEVGRCPPSLEGGHKLKGTRRFVMCSSIVSRFTLIASGIVFPHAVIVA